MTYKKKAIFLSALIAVLALAYVLSFIFDPQRQSRDSFAWLDPGLLVMADRIEIYGGIHADDIHADGIHADGIHADGIHAEDSIIFSRKNNVWVISSGATDYPIKQGRVEDLLTALSRKGLYPLRAASAEARERLGLVEGIASRIIIRGGAGSPLLDLLIGTGDSLGQGVYLRRQDKSEIHSGEDRFTLYTDSGPGAWYNLRLFPPIDLSAVQQAEITLPMKEDEEGDINTFVLRRLGEGWIIPGNNSVVLDTIRVETWLRSVLEAEGASFGGEAPAYVDGRINLRLGDGSSQIIQIGPGDKEKRRSAVVSESSLVYVLPEFTTNRLFRENSYFTR